MYGDSYCSWIYGETNNFEQNDIFIFYINCGDPEYAENSSTYYTSAPPPPQWSISNQCYSINCIKFKWIYLYHKYLHIDKIPKRNFFVSQQRKNRKKRDELLEYIWRRLCERGKCQSQQIKKFSIATLKKSKNGREKNWKCKLFKVIFFI